MMDCHDMTEEPCNFSKMNGDTVRVLFGEATVQQQLQCYTLGASAWKSYLDEDKVIAKEASQEKNT
jgi:hypothetical protein